MATTNPYNLPDPYAKAQNQGMSVAPPKIPATSPFAGPPSFIPPPQNVGGFTLPAGYEKIAHPSLVNQYEDVRPDPTRTFLFGKKKLSQPIVPPVQTTAKTTPMQVNPPSKEALRMPVGAGLPKEIPVKPGPWIETSKIIAAGNKPVVSIPPENPWQPDSNNPRTSAAQDAATRLKADTASRKGVIETVPLRDRVTDNEINLPNTWQSKVIKGVYDLADIPEKIVKSYGAMGESFKNLSQGKSDSLVPDRTQEKANSKFFVPTYQEDLQSMIDSGVAPWIAYGLVAPQAVVDISMVADPLVRAGGDAAKKYLTEQAAQKEFRTMMGLGENYTKEDLTKAYRGLAHKYHPDVPGGSEQIFGDIAKAKAYLEANATAPNTARKAILDSIAKAFGSAEDTSKMTMDQLMGAAAKTGRKAPPKMIEKTGIDYMYTFGGSAGKNKAKYDKIAGDIFGVKGEFYEISDKNAKIIATEAELNILRSGIKMMLSDIFDNPEVYDNWPEMKSATVVYDPTITDENVLMGHNEQTNEFIITREGMKVMEGKKGSIDAKKSILHETQHWVQAKEGMQPGANDDSIKYEPIYDAKVVQDLYGKVIEERKKLSNAYNDALIAGNTSTSVLLEMGKELDKMIETVDMTRALLDKKVTDFKKLESYLRDTELGQLLATEYYSRTAGEVMARATEARSELSAAERAKTPILKDVTYIDARNRAMRPMKADKIILQDIDKRNFLMKASQGMQQNLNATQLKQLLLPAPEYPINIKQAEKTYRWEASGIPNFRYPKLKILDMLKGKKATNRAEIQAFLNNPKNMVTGEERKLIKELLDDEYFQPRWKAEVRPELQPIPAGQFQDALDRGLMRLYKATRPSKNTMTEFRRVAPRKYNEIGYSGPGMRLSYYERLFYSPDIKSKAFSTHFKRQRGDSDMLVEGYAGHVRGFNIRLSKGSRFYGQVKKARLIVESQTDLLKKGARNFQNAYRSPQLYNRIKNGDFFYTFDGYRFTKLKKTDRDYAAKKMAELTSTPIGYFKEDMIVGGALAPDGGVYPVAISKKDIVGGLYEYKKYANVQRYDQATMANRMLREEMRIAARDGYDEIWMPGEKMIHETEFGNYGEQQYQKMVKGSDTEIKQGDFVRLLKVPEVNPNATVLPDFWKYQFETYKTIVLDTAGDHILVGIFDYEYQRIKTLEADLETLDKRRREQIRHVTSENRKASIEDARKHYEETKKELDKRRAVYTSNHVGWVKKDDLLVAKPISSGLIEEGDLIADKDNMQLQIEIVTGKKSTTELNTIRIFSGYREGDSAEVMNELLKNYFDSDEDQKIDIITQLTIHGRNHEKLDIHPESNVDIEPRGAVMIRKALMENSTKLKALETIHDRMVKFVRPGPATGSLDRQMKLKKYVPDKYHKDIEEYMDLYQNGGVEKEISRLRYSATKLGTMNAYTMNGREYWLKRHHATEDTDDFGYTIYRIKLNKDMGRMPVDAFGFAGGIQQDDDGNVTYNPVIGVAGAIGFGALRKIRINKTGALREMKLTSLKGVPLKQTGDWVILYHPTTKAGAAVLRDFGFITERMALNLPENLMREGQVGIYLTADKALAGTMGEEVVEVAVPKRQYAKWFNGRIDLIKNAEKEKAEALKKGDMEQVRTNENQIKHTMDYEPYNDTDKLDQFIFTEDGDIFPRLTTKVLEALKNEPEIIKRDRAMQLLRTELGKGLKKAELDIVNDAMEQQAGDKIDVAKLKQDIKIRLVPLYPFINKGQATEHIDYNEGWYNNPNNYFEAIYTSPYNTGDVGEKHFNDWYDEYFSHVRGEDIPAEAKKDIYGTDIPSPAEGKKSRKIFEIQSDLTQGGRLDRMVGKTENPESLSPSEYTDTTELMGRVSNYQRGLKKLQAYSKDTAAHLRTFREEVQRAVRDGVEVLYVADGKTAMKIEGLGTEAHSWYYRVEKPDGKMEFIDLKESDLKPGKHIINDRGAAGDPDRMDWIITKVLGDGKFKAIPEDIAIRSHELMPAGTTEEQFVQMLEAEVVRGQREYSETFDIGGKANSDHFVYKLMEEAIPKEAKKMGLTIKGKKEIFTGNYHVEEGGNFWKIEMPPQSPTYSIMSFNRKSPFEKPAQKDKGFLKHMKESENTEVGLLKRLYRQPRTYTPITNAETLAQAKLRISKGEAKAEEFIFRDKKPSAEKTITALELIRRYQKKGAHIKALRIVEQLDEQLRASGRAIQAAVLWDNLSPEAVVLRARKIVANTNLDLGSWQKDVRFTEQHAAELYELAKKRQEAVDPAIKEELDHEIGAFLNKFKKPKILDKVSSAQTQMQLLNPKTMIRNVLGNEIFFRLERLNRLTAVPIDWATSVLTGKRTVSLYKNQGEYWKNFIRGAEIGWKGVPMPDFSTQYDLPTQTFKSKWNPFFWGEKMLGATLRGMDYAALMRAKNQAIGELLYLRNRAEGKGILDARRIAKSDIDEVDENILQIAQDYGKYVTFQDSNVLSRTAVGIKKLLNMNKGFGIGDIVLKYPKTPAALLMRGIEYSPAGILRSLYILSEPALKKGAAFNQREFVLALSRAITGFLGLTALGYFLADKGLITGKPDRDQDVKAFQRIVGLGRYQINYTAIRRWILSGFKPEAAEVKEGDKLISYDWAQPVAISLSIGANINQNLEDNAGKLSGLGQTFLESLAGGVDTIQEQPLVSGLTRLFGYGDIMGGFIATIQGIPSSFTPTLLNQITQYYDNTGREYYDPSGIKQALNLAKRKIPGVAETLPERKDVLGRTGENFQGGSNNIFNVFFNPAFITTFTQTPEARLVLDIYKQTGDKGVFPRVAAKSLTINGEKKTLTAQEYTQLQQFIGQRTVEEFGKLAADQSFFNIPVEDQAKRMGAILTDIGKEAKEKLFGDKPKKSAANELLDTIKTATSTTEKHKAILDAAIDNPEALKQVIDILKEKPKSEEMKYIDKLGIKNGERAIYILGRLKTLKGPDEKKKFIMDLGDAKLLTADTIKSITAELKNLTKATSTVK